MLRKLVRYELKKQLSGFFFVILLILLVAVNVLLNCGIPTSLLITLATSFITSCLVLSK